MRSHAIAKHRVKESALFEFTRRCQLLSQSGMRYTSKLKILKLLGRNAASPSHLRTAVRVLKGHMVFVNGNRGIRPKWSSTMKPPVRKPTIIAPEDRGRRVTAARLRASGFVHDFTSIKFSELATAYSTAHPQAGGPKALAETQMIERYLRWAEGRGRCAGRAIVSTDLPPEYFKQLGGILQPASMKNHAVSIIKLLQLGPTEPTLAPFFPRSQRRAVKSAKKVWGSLKKAVESEARRLQRLKMRKIQFKNVPLHEVCLYLEDMWKTGKFSENCKMLKSRFELGKMLSLQDCERFRENLCVLSLYMALHGQRKSTAFRMLPGELMEPLQLEGRYIISVTHHKTYASSGPALIALKKHQMRAMEMFADARKSISGPDTPILSSLTGKEPSNVFSPLNKHLVEAHGLSKPITFNSFRKTVETNRDLVSQGPEQQGRYRLSSDLISGYLLHGANAVVNHYDFQTARKVVMKASEVEDVMSQLIAMSFVQSDSSNMLPASHSGV